ncbi:hypothetical protein MASR1M12_07890 [Erysipelotrichia bacterium]
MKKFRAILEKFKGTAGLTFSLAKKLEPEETLLVVKKIDDIFLQTSSKIPAPDDIYDSFMAIKNDWQREKSLKNTNRRHIRKLPWAIFFRKSDEDYVLSDDKIFLLHVFEDLKALKSTSRLISVLNEFFVHYPDSHREYWVKQLKNAINDCDSPRFAAIRSRIRRYSLLSDSAPENFAEQMFINSSLESILNDAGFKNIASSSKFVREALFEALKILRFKLTERTVVKDKLVDFFQLFTLKEGFSIGDSIFIDFVESLLIPFKTGDPEPEIKESIKSYLFEALGHPEIRIGNWNRISAEAKSVFLSWLTGDTLKDFFEILDITAGEQWQYRSDFWWAVYERKLIRRAWVILGSKARAVMARFSERTRSYGILNGASSDQSVLLMEIKNFIVAEWSHSGKCRFWLSDVGSAPQLYSRDYSSSSLRAEAFADFTHYSSETCRWQNEIADFLRRETGVKIIMHEYFSRRS